MLNLSQQSVGSPIRRLPIYREPLIENGRAGQMPATGYLLDEKRASALAIRIRAGLNGQVELWRGPARAVFFLTRHCNLGCTYCQSRGRDAVPFASPEVERLLDELSHDGTHHIHFTGGEPSTYPSLVALTHQARLLEFGASISTNAVAGSGFCIQLVQAGMQRFYISLDSFDSDAFDQVTNSRRQLPRVLDAIRGLVTARDSGRDVHVTINSVLGRSQVIRFLHDDARMLRSMLRELIGLRPDDFKLLPDATAARPLFEDEAEKSRFVQLCKQWVPESFRMFHYRIDNLKRGGHGLSSEKPHFCYHTVDDRVFAADGVYPCIIQLREGGRRLYGHEDSPKEKESALQDFICSDRRCDRICLKHCFDVYRCLSTSVERNLRP